MPVRIERDGMTGLDKALAIGPDVALVDIGLPGVDGFEWSCWAAPAPAAPGSGRPGPGHDEVVTGCEQGPPEPGRMRYPGYGKPPRRRK